MARIVISVLIASVAFLALYVKQGESVYCYVCSDDIDPRCGDPFNRTNHRYRGYLVTDCDRERGASTYLRQKAVCRKFKHTVNNQDVVVRSCSWESNRDEDGPCSQFALPPNTRIHYCVTCDTDECNSAVTAKFLSTLIALPLALLAPRYLC
uniref:Uncharacterized protein n=1 Tax=Lygus hesperus TaxID=30085 RepID=A0A146MCS9_LYGHE